MQLVGVAMMVLALMWLVVADDPFPMWLILAGGGVTFLGVGASIRTHDN
jgi:tetrahydromethanopterin S-methyltransferase subunit E